MQYRADIDGLRAVAVLPVVLYHADVPGPSGGFIGVDVFFVISGYLITSIVWKEISQGRFSLISFYERRARRILPALVLVVLATFLAGWFVLLPGELKDLGQSALATAFFASNVYFLLSLDYFARAADFAPLLHTWSLAVEEQFYIFFPPLLMAVAFLARHRQASLIVVCLSALSLAAAVLVLPYRSEWAFYLIFFRAWELGAGAALALAVPTVPSRPLVRELLASLGLLAIIVPIFIYDSSTAFPGLAALPPVLGATVIIWIGSRDRGSRVSMALGNRGLVWIGLISYSLYLWHWPILAFLRILLDSATLPILLGLAAIVLSLLAAWGSYMFVERPFRSRSAEEKGRRPIFLYSLGSLGLVAAIGASMSFSNGVPTRLPENAAAIAAAAMDRNPRVSDCLGRSPDEGFCRLGDQSDGQVDFILWGDSHAGAIIPGFDRAANGISQRGVFAGERACPPIRGIERTSDGLRCTSFNDAVWSWLQERDDVQLVVLSARWPLSVEGTRFRQEAGDEVLLDWIGGPRAQPDHVDNAVLVELGLRETVAAIVATGRDVVILGPVPEVGVDVPAKTARSALLGLSQSVDLSRAAHDARSGRTEEILVRLADETDGVRYLPLADLFCDQTQCSVHDGQGTPLYVDDDHITSTTAVNLVSPRLERIWLEDG